MGRTREGTLRGVEIAGGLPMSLLYTGPSKSNDETSNHKLTVITYPFFSEEGYDANIFICVHHECRQVLANSQTFR